MARREVQNPVATKDSLLGTKFEHPAFGCITVTRPQGGHNVMFGSEILHNSYVNLQIHEAVGYYDHGYKSHMPGKLIASVKMTSDQWARMVSAIGVGSGTPCTLEWVRGEGPKPNIPEPELCKLQKMTITEKGQQAVDAANQMVEEINALVASGKLSKKAAEKLLGQAHSTIDVVKGTIPFVVEQAVEHVEAVVVDAKATVEAHLNTLVYDAGLEHLKGLRDMAPQGKIE